MNLIRRPLIGVSLDYYDPEVHEASRFFAHHPFYVWRSGYERSIWNAGGIAIGIPCRLEGIEDYINQIDGLVLTGGGHDVHPSRYGQSLHPQTKLNSIREEFEWNLLTAFWSTQKPVLGICAGFQLMNVFKGGTLHQHLPDWDPTIDHSPKDPKQIAHSLTILPQTRLAQIGCSLPSSVPINSSHHQGIETLAPGLITSGICEEDGLLEAFEDPAHPFYIGCQWHPEFQVSPLDPLIWREFIRICSIGKV